MIQTRSLLGVVCAFGAVLTPLMGAFGAQSNNRGPVPAARNDVGAHSTQTQESEGQRLFEIHCSRCHFAPEGFSPRISGTVVRHMRVRASLSQHEEQELLHFFNP